MRVSNSYKEHVISISLPNADEGVPMKPATHSMV